MLLVLSLWSFAGLVDLQTLSAAAAVGNSGGFGGPEGGSFGPPIPVNPLVPSSIASAAATAEAATAATTAQAASITVQQQPVGYSRDYYGKGFQGVSMTPQNQPRSSSDPAIAVRQHDNGTAQVLQAGNSFFKVQLVLPGGGSPSDQTRLLNFSSLAAAVTATANNASIDYTTSDAIYDQDDGHFILLFSGQQRSGTTPSATGRMILAVSETSEGSTTYWVYRLDPNFPVQYNCTSSAGAQNPVSALTYPRLTYDRFGIYISYNLECFRTDGTQGVPQYALIAAIPKEAAYTGALTRYAVYTSGQMFQGLSYQQQPNVTAFDLQQGLTRAAFQPVRPQTAADVSERAFFVTQILVSTVMIAGD